MKTLSQLITDNTIIEGLTKEEAEVFIKEGFFSGLGKLLGWGAGKVQKAANDFSDSFNNAFIAAQLGAAKSKDEKSKKDSEEFAEKVKDCKSDKELLEKYKVYGEALLKTLKDRKSPLWAISVKRQLANMGKELNDKEALELSEKLQKAIDEQWKSDEIKKVEKVLDNTEKKVGDAIKKEEEKNDKENKKEDGEVKKEEDSKAIDAAAEGDDDKKSKKLADKAKEALNKAKDNEDLCKIYMAVADKLIKEKSDSVNICTLFLDKLVVAAEACGSKDGQAKAKELAAYIKETFEKSDIESAKEEVKAANDKAGADSSKVTKDADGKDKEEKGDKEDKAEEVEQGVEDAVKEDSSILAPLCKKAGLDEDALVEYITYHLAYETKKKTSKDENGKDKHTYTTKVLKDGVDIESDEFKNTVTGMGITICGAIIVDDPEMIVNICTALKLKELSKEKLISAIENLAKKRETLKNNRKNKKSNDSTKEGEAKEDETKEK